MSESMTPNWKPSPELLAAYADGELDSRDDVDELRGRIEKWLARNPAARIDLANNRALKSLFEKTSPREPSREAWRDMIQRIERRPAPTVPVRSSAVAWLVGVAVAAACAIGAVIVGGWSLKPVDEPEVLIVATNDDVEIMHVEGDAVDCIVVGLLPLDGVLNLADPGEVIITSITPARRDNMMPVVHREQRPMIWAKVGGEGD